METSSYHQQPVQGFKPSHGGEIDFEDERVEQDVSEKLSSSSLLKETEQPLQLELLRNNEDYADSRTKNLYLKRTNSSPRRTIREVKEAETEQTRSLDIKISNLQQNETCAPVSPQYTSKRSGFGSFTPRGAMSAVMRSSITTSVSYQNDLISSPKCPSKSSKNNNEDDNLQAIAHTVASPVSAPLIARERPAPIQVDSPQPLGASRKGPTEMALRTHREVVHNVKDFITSPVPIALGTLQCSLTNYQVQGEGLFSSPTEVWELRITDTRVIYEGIGTFTNVPDATGAGFAMDGPQVTDLRKNRLVVVAEKRTRGFMHKTSSFLFTMADCGAYHQRITQKASHLVGKLEGENVWGTEYTGYDLSENLKSRQYAIPVKKECFHVRYDCTVGNPRQLLVAIPRLSKEAEERASGKGPETDPSTGRERDAEDEPGLWQNEIPPSPDMDLGCQVVPAYKHSNAKSLALASEEYDQNNCLCFHNRKPLWDDELQTHILDFGGRVTHPSVKNFQLDPSRDIDEHTFVDYDCDDEFLIYSTDREVHSRPPLVQFGRSAASSPATGVSNFTLDVRYPFSPLQAMQLAMTSVEHKIVYK